jgi:hypothetical protein
MTALKKAFVGLAIIALIGWAASGLQLSSVVGTATFSDSILTDINDWPYRYWDGQWLIAYTYFGDPTHPSIRIYDRTGKYVDAASVWFTDAKRVDLGHVGTSRQGRLFVPGATTSDTGQVAYFVAEVAPGGGVSRIIRTTPYVPVFACSTGDGTVWTFGYEKVSGNLATYDHPLLRHYSFTKGLIAGYFNRSDLSTTSHFPFQGRHPGQTNMRCTPNSVVVYNGPTDQLIRYDLATSKLEVVSVQPLPQRISDLVWTGFAVTDGGDLFASFNDMRQSPPTTGLFTLQIQPSGQAQWTPVSGTVGPQGNGKFDRLLGSDGTNIVYMTSWGSGSIAFASLAH